MTQKFFSPYNNTLLRNLRYDKMKSRKRIGLLKKLILAEKIKEKDLKMQIDRLNIYDSKGRKKSRTKRGGERT